MSVDRTLTAERVRELFDYDPATGQLIRRTSSGCWRAGQVAGHVTASGYRSVSLGGKPYRAHRLIWLHVYGAWPADQIDHINGVRDDNRIANLREATNRQNCHNLHGLSRRNTSGVLGVSRDRGRWRAHLQVDGRQHNLGCFGTLAEASAAYLAGKRELHPFWAETE